MKVLIFIFILLLTSCRGKEEPYCETRIGDVLYNVESDNCMISPETIDTYTSEAITEVYVNLGENLYEPCNVEYDGNDYTICDKSTSMLNSIKYFVSETEYLSCELFSWYLYFNRYDDVPKIEHHYTYVCKE